MPDESNNRSLARLTAHQSIAPVAADPIENAIVLWAEASTRTETRDREERLSDKQKIIRSFLNFVGKHPGEVDPMDVRAWRKHLESEKSENTVYSYLSRVSSFYEWLRTHPGIKEHIPHNPVSLGRPKAPRPYQTEKTKAWTDDEMNSILDAIAAEAKKGSIHALRDYAVTLFYLFSGLRRNELFGLRGNDVELQEDGLIIRYKRKGGKHQRREVRQAEVREALEAYLKKSKQLSVLHTGDPIWTRHDRAGAPGESLTSRSFANNLKKYAAKAGIRQVNIHQTRHTYARIIFEDSGDLLETQSALDHENQATTRVYVHTIAVKRDKQSDRIARRIRRRN
ncbi:MAG TPA: tyrosine-type recombinase/integrase [Blastocatellia bacterium]|nr:tyrosine-type recombinase/integrase [Blastocatellia bacterium]